MTTMSQADAVELFRQPPERFLDVGEGEAAYRRVGSGPDVLFVHGWPVTGATFRRLLPHLAEHVTCHVVDLPGTGSSRFDRSTHLSIDQHVISVRRVIDRLELDDVAVVGHDSGGLIARHAVVGDGRLRGLGLINTEQMRLSWRFKSFLSIRALPGIGRGLGMAVANRRIRRSKLVLGDAFLDRSLLDGEFDEFFLQPLSQDPAIQEAGIRLLRSFGTRLIDELGDVHARLDVPVQLVWGEHDPFFPLDWAREMVGTFPDAQLSVIADAGLFSHEEKPAEVAEALLPVLTGTR